MTGFGSDRQPLRNHMEMLEAELDTAREELGQARREIKTLREELDVERLAGDEATRGLESRLLDVNEQLLFARAKLDASQADARAAVEAAEHARVTAQATTVSHETASAPPPVLTLDGAPRPPSAAFRARRIAGRAARFALRVATGQFAAHTRERARIAALIERVRAHPLFDAGYYLARQQNALPPDTDAAAHYVWVGGAAGMDPHPLFDTQFYRSRIDLAPSELPLIHYIDNGGTVDPHPVFDTAFYTARCKPSPGQTPLEHYLAQPAGAAHGANAMFDMEWYRSRHLSGETTDPLVHFVTVGEPQGLDPHPAFDTAWYRAQHPGVGDTGGLGHWLRSEAPGPTRPWPAIAADLRSSDLAFPECATPRVSIIIPAYGAYEQTFRCLMAVSAHTPLEGGFEVILADDNPANPIAPLFGNRPGLHAYVNTSNLGFLRNCNAAAARARGDFLVFLNNDTLVGQDWLRPMLRLMDDDTVGMVGCKLLNLDGSVQEAGGSMLSNGWGWPYGAGDDAQRYAYNFVRDVDVVTGACFVVRRVDFDAVGGFDDRYAPAFYEEFDLAFALKARGLRVMYQPASEVVHLGSASYGTEIRDLQNERNQALFVEKWRAELPYQPGPDLPAFVAREHRSERGVILVIDDKVPEYDKHAGSVTLFQYLCLMQEIGLKVIYHPINAQALQPYTVVLQQRGIEVLHAPDDLGRWLATHGAFIDHIWTARPDTAGPVLDLLKARTGARILYYTHDLHYLREGRRYELDGDPWAHQESVRLKPIELGIFASVDRVMTPSEEEARVIRAEVPSAHVTVIPPYLFDTAGTADTAAIDYAARHNLIFVGGFDHVPNVDAAVWLVNDIMPLVWRERPSVRLLIVGNVPPPSVTALAGERVEVTGFVPDLKPYYLRARASVSPLRYGAGVKGKIVGSLREGVPVVTTSIGNEGIRLRHGTDALIGDTPEALAHAILSLYADDGLCASLGAAGARVLTRQFSAERARAVLLRLIGDDVCPVCGVRPRYPGYAGASWRESPSCTACGALNRMSAVAEVLLRPFHAKRAVSLHGARHLFARLRIHEFGFVGPVQDMLRGDHFTASDFFPDVRPGSRAANGVMCQDLQALTFEDESLDLAISQEVMEHVPDMERAWREVFRVLRPGGRHVFSIPYAETRGETLRRAEIVDGDVRHILPPEYHGDPIREQGALAFWDYGADLPDFLRGIGFTVVVHALDRDGERAIVFDATKPA